MWKILKVNYKYTDNIELANEWLQELPNLIACDFEVAAIYNKKKKERIKKLLNLELKKTKQDWERIRQLEQILTIDGLSYPSQTIPTHLSIAWSDKDAMVIILPNKEIRELVCNFLVSTTRRQIWHNLSFDGSILKYITGKLPLVWEDTMLMIKCVNNNVEDIKCECSLKKLEGHNYGNWAIAKDNFTLEEMYNPDMIQYSAIDSCATMKLYYEIRNETDYE